MRFSKSERLSAGLSSTTLAHAIGPRQPLTLTPEPTRRLGDRRLGVGADQILLVERSRTPGVDFRYRIFNNSGDEVEHCGNGARCFVRFVHERGLTTLLHASCERARGRGLGPLRVRGLDVAAPAPTDPGVMAPAVHRDLEPPRTSTHSSAWGGQHEGDVVRGSRCVGPGRAGDAPTAAARVPARPRVEVGERPVRDTDRCADEDGLRHVPVTSAMKASMRASSASAS